MHWNGGEKAALAYESAKGESAGLRRSTMSDASESQSRLWAVIVSYGFEEEYERDWLGRIRSRRTKRYLRTEIAPELAQLIAGAHAQLGGLTRTAKAAVAPSAEAFRRALFRQEAERPESNRPEWTSVLSSNKETRMIFAG